MHLFYDAHNHLQDAALALHMAALADQLPALGLCEAVVNGTCEDDWAAVKSLADHLPWVHPSFGLHPWDVGNRSPQWREHFRESFLNCPGAAVGEIGLDRWMLEQARPDDTRLAGLRRAPMEEQMEIFLWQLAFATERNLPVSIHCLAAWGALDEALRKTKVPDHGFLLHAYSGPAEMVKGFTDLGAYFSFNGAFLEDRKTRVREAFKIIPMDRLLVETDAPAMVVPLGWRTHKLPRAPTGELINHPGNIEAAYAGLAALCGLSIDELAIQVEKTSTSYSTEARGSFSAIPRTTSPAAARPKAPVTKAEVPKPVAQSSLDSEPGSGCIEHVPSLHGKTTGSPEYTQRTPKVLCFPLVNP